MSKKRTGERHIIGDGHMLGVLDNEGTTQDVLNGGL